MNVREFFEGDWVRFYRDSRLVIAEVRYVRERMGWKYLQTDRGEVREDAVFECRPKASEEDR